MTGAEQHERLTHWVSVAITMVAIGLLLLMTSVFAHEHQPGESAEAKRLVTWLREWKRPSGNFSGVKHRQESCCYADGPSKDCFVIKRVRQANGVTSVLPDTEGNPLHEMYNRWYEVNNGIDEDLQLDPRESPDGRSYVCIQGQMPVCYVRGSGG